MLLHEIYSVGAAAATPRPVDLCHGSYLHDAVVAFGFYCSGCIPSRGDENLTLDNEDKAALYNSRGDKDLVLLLM